MDASGGIVISILHGNRSQATVMMTVSRWHSSMCGVYQVLTATEYCACLHTQVPTHHKRCVTTGCSTNHPKRVDTLCNCTELCSRSARTRHRYSAAVSGYEST